MDGTELHDTPGEAGRIKLWATVGQTSSSKVQGAQTRHAQQSSDVLNINVHVLLFSEIIFMHHNDNMFKISLKKTRPPPTISNFANNVQMGFQ